MKSILTFTILLFSTFLFSQNTISGKVVDQKGNPIAGANIYIDGTYDGTSSDDNGNFSFIELLIICIEFIIINLSFYPI